MFFGEEQKDYFAWFVAQPSADLEAELTIDGVKRDLIGNGSFSAALLNSITKGLLSAGHKIDLIDLTQTDLIL